MATKTHAVTEIARDYAARFPSAGTRTLARMILKDAPAAFMDFEHARTTLRRVRGEAGATSRKGKVVETTKQEFHFKMPKSDARAVRPHKLRVTGQGMIAGDWHVPYHDRRACDAAVNFAIKSGHTDWLLINGDFIDCYSLSSFDRDPRARDFEDEIKTTQSILQDLKSAFSRVIYKRGNHEDRYERYLRRKAPELLGVEAFEWTRVVLQHTKDSDNGIEDVGSNEVIEIGDTNVLHGHEYKFAIQNPVNPARGLFTRAKAKSVCSHFHQTSEHGDADIRRRQMPCWSIGCLCSLSPEYMPLNKWNHGFALAAVSGKSCEIDNRRIERGRVS